MLHARTNSRHLQLLAMSLAIIAAAIAMTGCGNDSTNHNPTGVAITPLSEPSQACAAGTSYQGNTWHQTVYSEFNITPYGYNASYQQGSQQRFGGCGSGAQAMCDAQYGLICVPVQVLGQHNVVYFAHGQNGFAYSGYGNVYDNGDMRGRIRQPRRFANQVGLTCQVGVPSCGHRSHCRPLAPHSSVGVCAR